MELKYHHSQNLVWKCSLQNVGHFCGRCVYVYTTLRMLPGNSCHTYLMKYSWTNKNTDLYCDWSDNCTITWTWNGSLLSIIMIFLSTKPPYMTSWIEWIIETCWHITPITHYGWGKWCGWTAKYARSYIWPNLEYCNMICRQLNRVNLILLSWCNKSPCAQSWIFKVNLTKRLNLFYNKEPSM